MSAEVSALPQSRSTSLADDMPAPAALRLGMRARFAVIGVSASLGLLLILLAVPRIYAELLLLPGNPLINTIANDDESDVTTPEIEALLASRERAIGWTESGHVRLELAAAAILLAQREVGGGTRYHALMARARDALKGSLARSPADPYAWTRLAYAQLAEDETADRIVPILAMAIRTAPVEAALIFPRLELCLIEWPYFPRAHADLFAEQVKLAWRQSHWRLVRLAIATGRRDEVRALLGPADQAEFDRVAADL
jgi:hypothetical protein